MLRYKDIGCLVVCYPLTRQGRFMAILFQALFCTRSCVVTHYPRGRGECQNIPALWDKRAPYTSISYIPKQPIHVTLVRNSSQTLNYAYALLFYASCINACWKFTLLFPECPSHFLTPFGQLCASTLARAYETHGVEEGCKAVRSL